MCQIYAKITEENYKIQKIQPTSPEYETMCITGIRKTYQQLCPVDTGRKLNVHMTFRRRSGRLLNVLCTFNLRPVSTGSAFPGCKVFVSNFE